MLLINRFLDALNGKGERLLSMDHNRGLTVELRAELPKAEKFDFLNLPFEPHESGRPGEWAIPQLTQAEADMWNMGLLPLPAPRCWFEFTLGTTRTGLYLRDEGDALAVSRIDHVHSPTAEGKTEWLVDGLTYRLAAGTLNVDVVTNTKVNVSGPAPLLLRERERIANLHSSNVNMVLLAVYLTLMLNSKTTEVTRGTPVKQKYTDQRKGKAAMPAFRIVNIVPKRFVDHGTGNGHGSPKRLHWRRSHLRRYTHQTAGGKWCSELIGPDGVKGCYAVVIPRHLCGKAELGEVSHEYRVT